MTKVFADGIAISSLEEFERNKSIFGYTTNPTLIRKLGVLNYLEYVREFLEKVPEKSVSVEILSTQDDASIIREAKLISSLGSNVCIKIPVTDTHGRLLGNPIRELACEGLSINVTAITTKNQIQHAAEWLAESRDSFISVFAGRIADTGVDPCPYIQLAVSEAEANQTLQVIWASPREVYNYVQARETKCDVITMSADLIAKLALLGKDLEEYSLETVRMFEEDARKSQYSIQN
jgi:transaldolase